MYCFSFDADIDLAGTPFTAIGYAAWNSFAGTFDGNGHTITYLPPRATPACLISCFVADARQGGNGYALALLQCGPYAATTARAESLAHSYNFGFCLNRNVVIFLYAILD